jgi:hypothetical protein
LVDVRVALECPLVHHAEHLRACCLGGLQVVRIEWAERIDGQPLLVKRAFAGCAPDEAAAISPATGWVVVRPTKQFQGWLPNRWHDPRSLAGE